MKDDKHVLKVQSGDQILSQCIVVAEHPDKTLHWKTSFSLEAKIYIQLSQ